MTEALAVAAAVDYVALFAATPSPYLVVSPDLVIVEANAAYCAATGLDRDAMIGRPIFEVFPDNPDTPAAAGTSNVRASLERARQTGRPDTMPLQRYDVQGPDGAWTEKYWSPLHVPVLDADGTAVLLLQRVVEVTDLVASRPVHVGPPRSADLRQRLEEAEVDVYSRALDLRAAWESDLATSRRRAEVADVAVELSRAQTPGEVVETVLRRGLAALGADGGEVAVLDGAVLHVTGARRGGPDGASVLPLAGPLPASVAAATGRPVLLGDEERSLAFAPAMAALVGVTGCRAWASLPLSSGGRSLGALGVGWARAHRFVPAEVQLLTAVAEQVSSALARIDDRRAERASLSAARGMAAALQRSLLTAPQEPDHLQVVVRYRPAAREAQVGGDWYDAFVDGDGSTCLVVGDVAGHDRDAAATMGQVRNLLRGVAYTLATGPAEVLSALDRAMRDLAVDSLTTAVLARVEQSGADAAAGLRRLRWSNAGHPPPLLLSPDGSARLLRTEAELLLGLDPATDRSDHERVLEPGSTVLLFSDGLVERRGASLDDGLAWLVECAGRCSALPLDDLCDALLEQVATTAEDDIALLAMRAHPE